jgi:phosphoribosylpyrophosphate synthetase
MKLLFMCGYHSDAATAAPGPDYLDAYRFCLAVRTGQFEEPFHIHTKSDRIRVTKNNIGLARRAYGKFIAKRIVEEGSWSNPLLVPIPSEDALIDAKEFRSWVMASEALAPIELKWSLVDALLWTEPPPPLELEASAARREAIAAVMTCDFPVRGQAVVLLDDLVSTGATLFAARDRLQAEGAVVLGAIACGRVVRDFDAMAFGRQEAWLEDEVAGADR